MENDSYQVIADRIIGLLEKGTVPWQKPWTAHTSPKNLTTLKDYRGINTFLLNAMMFESPFFLTFKQAKALGGNVKRGEKACPVVFWKWFEAQDTDSPSKIKRVPFLRYYSVFNISQCEGISATRIPIIGANKIEVNPIEQAEQILARMPNKPKLVIGGERACYRPSIDSVSIPQAASFRTMEDYYSVLFHELAHATGHQSRLNRKGVSGTDGEWSAFGSAPYAKEELVAEMGSAFLCGQADIVERTIENSASYISSWIAKLKEDKRLVVHAAAQAQKAADYILGKEKAETDETENQ